MLSKEYKEGSLHALKYGTHYSNPYKIDSKEYNDFERGWSQEIKKNPEAIAYADKLRKEREIATNVRTKEEIRKSRNEYKNAKEGK